MGPRTESCGTPTVRSLTDDFVSFNNLRQIEIGRTDKNGTTAEQFPWCQTSSPDVTVVTLVRRAKRDFYQSAFKDNKDIKSTWKTIKLLNGSAENSCVSSLEVGGKVIDDPSELAEEFNIHFSQIADKLTEKLPDLNSYISRLTNFANSRKDHNVVFTLLLKLLVFWRELVQTNQLVSTRLMRVYFDWLHQLLRRVM